MEKKRMGMHQKLVICLVSVTLVLCVVLSAAISNYYQYKMEGYYADRAEQQGYMITEYLDPELVASCIDQTISDEDYDAVQEYLEGVLEECDLEYLYVFVPKDDSMFYIWDTDEETLRTFGDTDPYYTDEDKEMILGIRDKVGHPIETVITNDEEYGYIASSYAPIIDDNNKVIAIVGLDLSMDVILGNVRAFRMVVIGIVMAIMFVFALVAYFIITKTILNPITALTDETKRLINNKDLGHTEFGIKKFANDEVGDLTQGFAYMVDSLKQYINNLTQVTAEIKEKSQRLDTMQHGTIMGMASMIESRDGSTGEHVKNTARYVEILAKEALKRGVYPEELTEEFVEQLVKAAPMHDIGKIAISDVILNKPGGFTDEEYAIMKSHTTEGGKIILKVLDGLADINYINIAQDVALFHHEKWDGSGYPSHLKGEEIPLAARIMAIADVYDALVAVRVYKAPMPREKVLNIIEKDAGTHFDPILAPIFVEIMR